MRTCQIVEFALPGEHRVKLKESEKRDKNLNPSKELEKTIRDESDGDPIYLSSRIWHNVNF